MKRLLVILSLLCLVFAPLALADNPTPTAPAVAPATAAPATPAVAAPVCPPCPACPVCPVATTAAPTDAPPTATPAAPAPAAAPEDIITKDPTSFFTNLVEAVQSKRWSPVIGSVLLALVWALRKFLWKKLPKKLVPWIAVGVGVVGTMGLTMLGNVIWWKALISGLVSGGQAIALWELGSSVLPKKE